MVDDNKININIATRLLKSGNYEIDKAYSGKECINKIESGKVYDMILMDDMMPGLSGTETLEYLKNNPDFKSTIVVVTANALSGSEEHYLKVGFDAYIPKPINREVLNETIEEFLYHKK